MNNEVIEETKMTEVGAIKEAIEKYEEKKSNIKVASNGALEFAKGFGIRYDNCPVCKFHGVDNDLDSCSPCSLELFCRPLVKNIVNALNSYNSRDVVESLDAMIHSMKDMVKKLEEKEEKEEMVNIGTRFMEEKSEYILASVTPTDFNLINLDSGMRWGNPIPGNLVQAQGVLVNLNSLLKILNKNVGNFKLKEEKK